MLSWLSVTAELLTPWQLSSQFTGNYVLLSMELSLDHSPVRSQNAGTGLVLESRLCDRDGRSHSEIGDREFAVHVAVRFRTHGGDATWRTIQQILSGGTGFKNLLRTFLTVGVVIRVGL